MHKTWMSTMTTLARTHTRHDILSQEKGSHHVSHFLETLTSSCSLALQEIRMSLLSDPAAIDVRDDRGQTAAHLVAWYGHAEVGRSCLG